MVRADLFTCKHCILYKADVFLSTTRSTISSHWPLPSLSSPGVSYKRRTALVHLILLNDMILLTTPTEERDTMGFKPETIFYSIDRAIPLDTQVRTTDHLYVFDDLILIATHTTNLQISIRDGKFQNKPPQASAPSTSNSQRKVTDNKQAKKVAAEVSEEDDLGWILTTLHEEFVFFVESKVRRLTLCPMFFMFPTPNN